MERENEIIEIEELFIKRSGLISAAIFFHEWLDSEVETREASVMIYRAIKDSIVESKKM